LQCTGELVIGSELRQLYQDDLDRAVTIGLSDEDDDL